MTLTATPSYGIEPSVVEAALATTPIFSLNGNLLLEMFGGKWQIAGDLALATEPVSGKSHYALMAMTHFKTTDYLGFTLRYSRFHDIGNLLADPGAHNNEWSVAALFLPLKIKAAPDWSAPLRELRLLLEGRIDTVGFDANTIAARIQLSVILPFKLTFQPAYRPGKVWK